MEFRFLTQKKKPAYLIKNNLFLFLFISVLVSCSKYKEGDFIDNNDRVPPSPSIMTYFTVEGADDDLDGVRDDIEIWINEEFDDPNIRMALKQESREEYKFMFAASTVEILRIIENSRRATSCWMALVLQRREVLSERKYNNYLKNIWNSRKKMTNNWWRERKMKEANKYVPSGSYSGPEGNFLKSLSYCLFEIQNKKKILQYIYNSGLYKNNASTEEREEYIRLLRGLE